MNQIFIFPSFLSLLIEVIRHAKKVREKTLDCKKIIEARNKEKTKAEFPKGKKKTLADSEKGIMHTCTHALASYIKPGKKYLVKQGQSV